MTDRLIAKTRVVPVALVLAVLAGAASTALAAVPGAGAATQPARSAQLGRSLSPVSTSVPPVATKPAPGQNARSTIGGQVIRAGAAAGASTRPAVSSTAQSSTTTIPPAAGSVSLSLGLPRVAGALAIVLALIFALCWLMRRTIDPAGAAGASRAVQVLSRTILAPKQQVLLLRVGRRVVVVADSAGQMTTLSEITDPDEAAALIGQVREEKLTAAAPAFGGLLGRFGGKMRGAGSAEDVEEMPPATHADRFGQSDEARREGRDEAPVGSGDEGLGTDATRREIDGLLAKVRFISSQFKGS